MTEENKSTEPESHVETKPENPRLKLVRDSLNGLDKDNAGKYLDLMLGFEGRFDALTNELMSDGVLHRHLKIATCYTAVAGVVQMISKIEGPRGLMTCHEIITDIFRSTKR